MYRPYGEPIETTGTPQTDFGWTGEQTDGTGLVYLRARYYNPTIGVFPSLDPLEGGAGQPMSLNRYMWVQGNVVNATDPSGLRIRACLTDKKTGQCKPACFAQAMAQIVLPPNTLTSYDWFFTNGDIDSDLIQNPGNVTLNKPIEAFGSPGRGIDFLTVGAGDGYIDSLVCNEPDQKSPASEPVLKGAPSPVLSLALLMATLLWLRNQGKTQTAPVGSTLTNAELQKLNQAIGSNIPVHTPSDILGNSSTPTNVIIPNSPAGYICPGCHGNVPTWVGPLDERPSTETPAWVYVVPFAILGLGIAAPFVGADILWLLASGASCGLSLQPG